MATHGAAGSELAARWLALLFLVGGAFTAGAILFLPMPDSVDATATALLGLAAGLIGAAIWLNRRRLPAAALPFLLPLATVIVSLSAYYSGETPTGDPLFYFWVTLYAACFFSTRQMVVQIVLIAVCYGAAELALGTGAGGFARWAAAVTTVAIAAVVVSRLVRRLRDSLVAEEAAAVERERLLEQFANAALTDSLTGLPNRRALDDELGRQLARAERAGQGLILAILDLDHFKDYNDRRGHAAGDALLRDAASAWRAKLRAGDVLARYGGEEFVVLLQGCSEGDALALIDRLRAATPDGQTASAGLAAWGGGEPGAALMRRADVALYEAKAAGRNRAFIAPGHVAA